MGIRVDHVEIVTSEQRFEEGEGVGHVAIWGRNIPAE